LPEYDVQPNAYMKEILHSTECPILLLPERSDLPGSIVLAYDGTPSAVYAIKQFAYLFPELSDIPTYLVFVNSWITGRENPWLVTGSYGRSELSQLCFIAGMIREHKIPVFIAHT
jgi:hypothetical protein